MLQRVRFGLVAAALAASAAVVLTDPAGAQAPLERSSQGGSVNVKRGVALKASVKEAVEGDRVTLTARVKSPAAVSKVTLQKWQPPVFSGDKGEWEPVKTTKVRGKGKAKFFVVATDENTERYRAVVTYERAKAVTSKPLALTVWRWIPLSDYDPYYETGGAIFGTTTLNGHPYAGFGAATYSHVGAWETRFTPGRHCNSFRGVLGIADISHDQSSGSIKFTADDTVVYESPALTPGMDVPVTLPLANPYRFGVQLFDTTPGGTRDRDTIEAWPVIGDPALLCTGV